MLIDIQDFKDLKTKKQPIISLDIGEKRIGVAVSDRLWMIANSLEVIDHQKFTPSATRIHELFLDTKACAVVIGFPKNMDGTTGPRAQSVTDFAKNIERLFPDMPYIFWDERLSTVSAESMLIETDLTRKKRKTIIDKVAATVILQGFLDRLSNL